MLGPNTDASDVARCHAADPRGTIPCPTLRGMHAACTHNTDLPEYTVEIDVDTLARRRIKEDVLSVSITQPCGARRAMAGEDGWDDGAGKTEDEGKARRLMQVTQARQGHQGQGD
jgi:hypothetical protein